MTTKSVLCLLALFSCLLQAIAADPVIVDRVRSLPAQGHAIAGGGTGSGQDVTMMDNGDGTVMRGEEKLVRKARGGVVVWDTVNTPAICSLTRSIVMAVRETPPFAVTAMRRAEMPSAIQLNGSGIELPPGLTIPTTTINVGQCEAKLTLTPTDKMKEGVYSFIINSESRVPDGDKKIRCIYPSNPIKVTVEPKSK